MSDERVNRVAYAIAKVIAAREIAEDPKLSKLDGLGKASATHTMALQMAPMLRAEAEAAVAACDAELAQA